MIFFKNFSVYNKRNGMPRLVGKCHMPPRCIRKSTRKHTNIFGMTGGIGGGLEERN